MSKNRETEILNFLKKGEEYSSKEIHEGITSTISYATVKRIVTDLISENLITKTGKGKSTKYTIAPAYKIFEPINVSDYYKKEIDERNIIQKFNLTLITETLTKVSLFTKSELKTLSILQNQYQKNISILTDFEYKKELERLAIDLSWKSSQIEGNTYSLLETEQLLKEKQTASGKTKDEATMLLNHKDAIDFIIDTPEYVAPLSTSKIEDIHSLLIKELAANRNIRQRKVGISGTNYLPLDNEFQIKEALTSMCELVNKKENIFDKALLTLMLISYIQPFMDGNKRTARIVSNAILMNNKYCPLSFRTVDSIDYKKAMLIFYEQNNLTAFKKIFITQFEFAVNTYF
ncbi:MAG: Fic family protein [Flavobacteriales bacterium]|nr:Fic family protein [Flavobacteriales bacterium]